MEFLKIQVRVMMSLANFSSKSCKVAAFSLVEILVVLVIVGIMLTLPKWSIISEHLLSRADDRLYITQTKLDMVLLNQTWPTSKKSIDFDLQPLCEKEKISIYAGGWLNPKSLICNNRKITIGRLGEIRFETQ